MTMTTDTLARPLGLPDENLPLNVIELEGQCSHGSFRAILQKVWQSGHYSDLTLRARGGELRSHRMVLRATCSELLVGPNDHTIDLDVDVHILRLVLAFVYLNKIRCFVEDLPAVARAAQLLGVKTLHEMCRRTELSRTVITPANCLEMLVAADDIADDKVKACALHVALQHFLSLKNAAGFWSLPYDLLVKYISHPELKVEDPEDRFSAAIVWVKANSKARMDRLIPLMEILPLQQMAYWFLEDWTEDILVEEQPRALQIIWGILESAEDRQKAISLATDSLRQKNLEVEGRSFEVIPEVMSAKGPVRERCLVFAGAYIDDRCSDEVFAVRLDHNMAVVSLGRLGTSIPDWSTSCLVHEDTLFCSGLGPDGEEIWSFSLAQGKGQRCGRLNTGRSDHAMTVAHGNQLCVLGGRSPLVELYSDCTYRVEMMTLNTGKCTKTGILTYYKCWNLVGCGVNGGQQVLVCGGFDDLTNHYIQVYDVTTHTVTSAIPVPYAGCPDMYGAVCTKGRLVVVAEHYTAVIRVSDALQGRPARLCKNYVTPNHHCGVAVSGDDSTIMLLGGTPKAGCPKHYVYSTSVSALLRDSEAGWQRVHSPWTLGECEMTGGCDTAYISIHA